MFYRLKFRPLKCYFTRIALTFRHKINCYYTNQIAAVVLRRRNLLITSLAAAGFTFHTNGISDAELTELEKHATNQFVKHPADETGWEKFHTDEHITVYRRLMKNGIYEYRCVGSYPDISANDFIKAQYDLEYRKTWDNTLLNFEVLEEDSDSGSQLIRWDSRFGYTFGDRVYVFVQRKSIDPDSKSVSIICKGVDQNVYPLESQNQKSVRVTDYSSEMVIRAHQDMEKEGLDFELISHEDTQLGVPRMVSDYFAKDWGPDYLKKLYKAALKLAQIRQAEMQQQRPEEEKGEKPAEEEAPLSSVGKIETDEDEPAKQEDAETVTKEEEATSPQEEEEVESPPEAEEEVPEDPVARCRAECAKEERMQTLKKILEECNERVRTTPDSGESCHMEMVDWVHALDHCAMPKAFRELK